MWDKLQYNMYRRYKHPSKTALCTVSCYCFFSNQFTHGFTPVLHFSSLTILQIFSIKNRPPPPSLFPILHFTSLHSTSICFVHFTSLYFTLLRLYWIPFHFTLDFSLHFWHSLHLTSLVCSVWTSTLHITNRPVLYNRNEQCLQRGTDWGFK